MRDKTTLFWTSLALATALAAHAGETRIYYLGNSLTDELKYQAFVRLAATGGEKVIWGRHMCPGIPIRGLWGLRDGGGFVEQPFGPWGKALAEYEWDVLTLQPFCPFQGEYEHALLFAREVLKKSPGVQLCVYAQWPGKGRGADWDKAFSGPEAIPAWASKKGPTSYEAVVASVPDEFKQRFREHSLRNSYELIVLGLRQNVPTRKPPVLIPAGHAMQLLGQKMRAGLVPAYSTLWDLYTDGIHVNNDGSYLVACAFYATIFKKSPVGLPVGDYQGKPGYRGDCVEITPELARAIQETVWEAVATHPLTSVTSDEAFTVASPQLDTAVAGEPYRFEVLPAFGRWPYTWSLAAGTLPEGLKLSADGILSGTAAKEGAARVTLQVADARGGSAQRELELVVEKDIPPTIPAQALPRHAVGKFLEVRLKGEGGNGIHTWKVSEGQRLPHGLTLDPDGRLWGAPGKEGVYTFALTVQDGDSAKPETAEQTFRLEVGPAAGEVAIARRLAEKMALCDWKEEPDPARWNFRYPIRKLAQGEKATVDGDFDLAWDDDHLWVAVRVKDATHNKGARGLKLTGDNIVLCLDMNNDRQATYNADDRYMPFPRGSPWPSESRVGDAFCCACRQKELEGGYFVLLRVSLRHFGLPPESLPYRVVGLDLMLVDDAKDGQPRSMVVWQGTRDNATDPSRFGTVVLGE